MNVSCGFRGGRRIAGHSVLRAAVIVGLLVLGVVPVSAADTHAAPDEHSAESHDVHGGHGAEIGHNLPAGVAAKDFESPAWFQTDLALWSFAVFVILMLLLTRFAWKPIMEVLEKREQGIANTIAATQRAREDAKRMLESYERRLAEAAD